METRTIDATNKDERVKNHLKETNIKVADLEASRKVTAEEITYLRQVREDLMKERDELMSDVKGYQQEIESAFKQIKSVKSKNRKLEEILYGRKIGSTNSVHYQTIGGGG